MHEVGWRNWSGRRRLPSLCPIDYGRAQSTELRSAVYVKRSTYSPPRSQPFSPSLKTPRSHVEPFRSSMLSPAHSRRVLADRGGAGTLLTGYGGFDPDDAAAFLGGLRAAFSSSNTVPELGAPAAFALRYGRRV